MQPHLKILYTVAEAVSRTLDVEEILKTALEALTHVTGHEIASLHLLAADGVTLELRADRGLSREMREINRRLPVGQGIIGRVAASGMTTVVRNVADSPALLQAAQEAVRRDRIRGFVCVPVHARGRMLGTLSLGRQTDDPFDAAEVSLLEATAHQIAVALDNARLSSELVHIEKLSAIGQLASGVAHEINNPLTSILGLAQLMLGGDDVPPALRERIALVADEAARAAAIVRNLLMFARHYPSERRPCSLVDAVHRVIALKSYQLERDKIALTLDLADDLTVWADDNQLQQVLLNLVQNAHQAMLRHAGERALTVRLRQRDGGVTIEVIDTGPGIPPPLLSRIFDPFFTTKPPGEGSGLGLSVSYGIVAQHRGRLYAENRPEGGAVFVVELPTGEGGLIARQLARRVLVAGTLLAAAGCAGVGGPVPGAPPHHRQHGFGNTNAAFERPGFWTVQGFRARRLWASLAGSKPIPAFPRVANDGRALRDNHGTPTVTWIGHATLLIQLDGLNILTDPHFSERASPLSFAGPRRLNAPGLAFDALPPIDVVVISHDHYDHLDRPTVQRLAAAHRPLFLAPLGFKAWFASVGVDRVSELDWWETREVGPVRFTLTPGQHWCARTPFDTNRRLWGGWAVAGRARRIFFGGDTGYYEGFREIGARLGPFDLALVSIAAYEPPEIMRMTHTTPEQALRLFTDVRARSFVAMHWGTFDLSDEPLDEPPRRLRAAARAMNLPDERVWLLAHGETRAF